KTEPLSSHLQKHFEDYYLPRSNMAFDRMMVLFKDRFFYILKMPNKLINVGYKLYAFCEKRYTYSF
ncbi:hypothetical protein C7212DRAFT_56675, partial [Tuber magnatum]